MNLVPLFSAIMAITLLSEPFAPFHAVALVLVVGGICSPSALRAGMSGAPLIPVISAS